MCRLSVSSLRCLSAAISNDSVGYLDGLDTTVFFCLVLVDTYTFKEHVQTVVYVPLLDS